MDNPGEEGIGLTVDWFSELLYLTLVSRLHRVSLLLEDKIISGGKKF